MMTYLINFIKPMRKIQCTHKERHYGMYSLYHDHRNYNSKLEINGILEKAEGTTYKELIMNNLSSFSDPLILLLCSFHTVLN